MAFVPISGQPAFDLGYPVDGALLYAFDAGTTTPRTLYLTSALDGEHVHTVPVQMVNGVWPVMFAGPGDYDLVIYGQDGEQIRRLDGLPGDPAIGAPGATFDPLAQVSTGDIVLAHRYGTRAGYVRVGADGLTIGNGASVATERANDDCHALFVLLYTFDQSLAVSGGRSAAGAEADWSANKTITLPNESGRFNLPDGTVAHVYMKL